MHLHPHPSRGPATEDLDERLLGWLLPREPYPGLNATTLGKWLGKSSVDLAYLHSFVQFDMRGYHRRVLISSQAWELVLATWLPGQRSLIHDHGGSCGASRVMSGQLREVLYTPVDVGRLEEAATSIAHEGSILLETPTTIHQVTNSSNGPAISLHLYSPPQPTLRTWLPADVREHSTH